MHQKLLGTVAAVALVTALCGPVAAADLAVPRKAPPPAPALAIANWSGFYIGGHVGYGWAGFRADSVNTGFADSEDRPGSFNANGLVLGIHAGYNWQLGPAPWGSWLVGIEGDASSTNGFKGSRCTLEQFGISPSCTDRVFTSQLHWLASIRGRLGLTFDRTLVYATGGIAWAKADHSACVTDTCVQQDRGVVTGGVVGGGIEWKYNPSLALRIEALHYMFDEKKTAAVDCCEIFMTQGIRDVTVVRVGASWSFGPGDLLPWGIGKGKGPVVARY
jgi:outer membrane immunogenic protein